MRRRFLPSVASGCLFLLALALPLGGCLEGKQEITVGADGGGTIRQSFVVDQKKAAELFEMLKMLFGGGDLAADQMPDPFAEVWWRQLAQGVEGYTLGKVTDETKDGKRTVTTEAKYASLAAAGKAGAFFFSAVSLEKGTTDGGDASATPPATWKLSFKDSLSAAKDAAGGAANGMDFGALLLGFEPQLSTLSLTRVVTLPTKVVETNGKLDEDGRTVRWTVDFQKIVEGKDLELTIRFEAAEGLALAPFTHKPDTDTLMRRFMESAPKPPAAPAEPAPAEPAPAR